MPSSYNIKTAQRSLSALVKESQQHPVTLTKQGKPVAIVMSMERMEAIAETMEILADSSAMDAIRNYTSGKSSHHSLDALDNT